VERKKVLGFWDLTLFSFCAIFGVEAIATSAAIGPSAISWWLICTVGFFFPFGLIAAELGSTYPEQGGIYVWIKKALGNKWATRTIWYYWIALPIWLPAMYITIAEIIGHMFFPAMNLWSKVLIGIIMIWITVGINLCSLKFSKWIPNLGAITRLLLIAGMIAAAVVYFLKYKSFANEVTFTNILPNLNAAFIFVPMIIYNLIGIELMSGAAGEMKNPERDIPKTIMLSASVIVSLYLITTFAIWVVVPVAKINVVSGILQMFLILFSDHAMIQLIIIGVGLLLAATLFAEIVTWTLGENRIVAEAAQYGKLPKTLGKLTKVNLAPIGASVISGIISTTVIVIYGFIARDAAELFWHVISFSTVVGLLSYLILFPAFIILRSRDKNIKRPFKVPGPDWLAVGLANVIESRLVAQPNALSQFYETRTHLPNIDAKLLLADL